MTDHRIGKSYHNLEDMPRTGEVGEGVQVGERENIEKRYEAFGTTNDNKKLTIIFTLRENLIRIISARSQNKSERKKFQSITILSK